MGTASNTAVSAAVPRIFPVNLAVILRRWRGYLLRGFRGNAAFVCGNTAVVTLSTFKFKS